MENTCKPIDIWIHCLCSLNKSKITDSRTYENFEVSNKRIISFLNNKLNKIVISGLYDKVDFIYIVMHGFKEKYQWIIEDLKILYSKIIFILRPNYILESENPGFNKVLGFNGECDTFNLILKNVKNSNIDKNILYLHSKGFSYQENHPWVSGIEQWIRYFDYFLIHNWKKCQKVLETCDTTSLFLWQPYGVFDQVPLMHQRKLYAGNFWWSKSEHLKRLSYLTKDNHKWRSEHHIMDHPNGKYHDHGLYFNCPWTRDKDFLRCKFDPVQFIDDEHFFPKGW